MPSPSVSLSVHADAVRLARWQVVVRLPLLLAGALLAAFVVLSPRAVLLWGPVAFALVAEYARTVIEWLRLCRIDPADFFQRERQQRGEERDMAAQLAEHRARSSRARPLLTQGLLATVAAVTLVQFSMPGIERSVELAALVKPAARAGEWWRLLSASYLHGHLLHAAANLSALVALGGLIELYDRRTRVPLVYLAGVAGGGLASLLFTPGPSLGASAGVLALAGYLLMLGGACRPPGCPSGYNARCAPYLRAQRYSAWSDSSSSTTRLMWAASSRA